MNRYFSRSFAVVLLAAAGILTLSSEVAATERPYFANGTAQFDGVNIVGTGTATHLGQYDEAGTATITGTDPTALDVTASITYAAADGDELRAHVTGHFNAITGTITATVTYVGGTGRFEGASGTARLVAQFLPDGTIAVAVAGTIDY